MKKGFRILLATGAMLCGFLMTSCDLKSMIPGGNLPSQLPGGNSDGSDNGGLDFGDLSTMEGIYNLAVSQGFNGTYEEWINSLKGDSVEFRAAKGFIQWRYSKDSEWINLIPLEDISGSDGNDGLTPTVGENGNWWVGDYDTGMKANGSDGSDGITPTVGENGNWFIGDYDTKIKALGSDGKSAFEIFKELYPEYKGDERQWLDDLLNGRLSEENYKYYTVTFDYGDGNKTSEEVLAKSPVNKPESPRKIGHIFTGWYTKEGLKWNFDANVVIKDMTLKANFVKANIEPTVYFSSLTSDKHSVYFDIYKDTISEIDAISIYKGGELIKTLDNFDNKCFTNLLSNTEYRLEITYSYDLGDGYGKQTKTESKFITTNSLEAPTVRLDNIISTANSITFDILKEDIDETLAITSIDLLLNGKIVDKINKPLDLNSLSFTGLLSNKAYKINLNYSYDMNDGSKPEVGSIDATATTEALIKPVVTFNNAKSTQNEITADIIINDPSSIANLKSITLYKKNTNEVVSTGLDLNLRYINLDPNTAYKVVVEYTYDLNEGLGIISAKDEFEIATHPVYELLNTEILNTSAIVEDDSIFIHAEINNPSDAKFIKAWINGKEYDVDPSSTSSHIYVYIDSTDGELVQFKLEKLVASIDGNELLHYTEKNNFTSAKVYKKLGIKSIEYVNQDNQPVNYYFASEKEYVRINLDNPVGYTLDSVKIGEKTITNLTKLDNDTYIVESSDSIGFMNTSMYQYSYSLNELNKVTNTTIEIKEPAIKVNNDQIVEIYTIDDLLAMNSFNYRHTYYKLMNDLDLSGIEWIPTVNLQGVFDGNNHTIRNMKQARKVIDTDVEAGLFKKIDGAVINLNFENFVCMIDASSSKSEYNVYIGAISAYDRNSNLIKNCHVDDNSSISVIARNCNTLYLGGLVSNGSNTYIYDSSNSANISVKEKSGYVAGIAGNFERMVNCYNTGNITGINAEALGNTYNGSLVNCYNTGAINGKYEDKKIENFNSIIVSNSISFGKEYANKVIDYKPKEYSFETNGGNVIDNVNDIMVNTLPTPTKEGYYFYGWYDNKDFTGESLDGYYFSEKPAKLYAKWIEKVSDPSCMIENKGSNGNPFIVQDGVIKSTITNIDDDETSYYTINANSKLRIYYNYNIESINGGDGSMDVKFGRMENGYFSWKNLYPSENQLNYIDLMPGEKLMFEARHYTGKQIYMNITQLDICLVD